MGYKITQDKRYRRYRLPILNGWMGVNEGEMRVKWGETREFEGGLGGK